VHQLGFACTLPPVRSVCLSSQRPSMSRTAALNVLFLMASFTSAAVETILYRMALVAIVVMLGALWMRAVVRRTRNNTAQAILQSAEIIDSFLDNASQPQ
jgi:hypothetical protein